MTLVNNIDVPPEVYDLWIKSCTLRYGYFGEKVDKKDIVWRKRNFPSLIARGGFQNIADIWNGLTLAQQGDWDDAGYWAGMSGWDLFAQETLYRINNEIQGVATPNLYHQFKIAQIAVASPAVSMHIKQKYYNLPNTTIAWAFNIFSTMESIGGGSYAIFRVTVRTGYWNDDIDAPDVYVYDYDLTEFTTLWDYISDSYIDGLLSDNDITFEIIVYNMRGMLYIDGVELDYNDQNFALDFQCNEFYANWQSVNTPDGTTWGSIYPPDGLGE